MCSGSGKPLTAVLILLIDSLFLVAQSETNALNLLTVTSDLYIFH
jgi:hypothetical protein